MYIQGEIAQCQPVEYAVVDKSKKNRKIDEQQNVCKEQLKSSHELYFIKSYYAINFNQNVIIKYGST